MRLPPGYRGVRMARLTPSPSPCLAVLSGGLGDTTPTAEFRTFFADATLILTARNGGQARGTSGSHSHHPVRSSTSRGGQALARTRVEGSERGRARGVRAPVRGVSSGVIAWIPRGRGLTAVRGWTGRIRGGRQATVRTTVLGRNGRDLPVDYRMVERGDRSGRVRRRDRRREPGRQQPRPVHPGHPELLPIRRWCSSYGIRSPRRRRSSLPPSPWGRKQGRAVALERAARERPVPTLPHVAGTPRDNDATLRRVRPRHAQRSFVGPRLGEPVPTTPPAKNLIELSRPRTTRLGIPGDERSRPRSYWVQVAAVKSFGAAMRLASHLRGRSPCRPIGGPSSSTGLALARVRVGPFADRAEATSNLRQLASRGFKPFIAEESGDPR